MDIIEYKNIVIDLFKNKNPSDEYYKEMADAILEVAESNSFEKVSKIDAYIDKVNRS